MTRWKQATVEPLPPEASPLATHEWVRLIPLVGPELAELWTPDRGPRDEHGLPLGPARYTIDRKLIPLHDLMEPGAGGELLCSERFAKALAASALPGWSASLVPHITPHEVAGHPVYHLDVEGRVGPLLSPLQLNRKDPATFHARGTEGRLNGVPLAPVRFSAQGWTGHAMCWSPWLNGPRSWWRALLVRGDVVQSLRHHIPDLMLAIEPVELEGELVRQPLATASPPWEAPRVAPAPDMAHVLALMRSQEGSYPHVLHSPAKPGDLNQHDGKARPKLPEKLRALLAAHNGMRLFDGALVLHSIGENGTLSQYNEDLARYPWFRCRPGWLVFASTTGNQIWWAIDSDALVHGLGRDEIVYGPAAPLEHWLHDQLVDMAYAWNHDGELPWTERVLRG